MRNVGFPAFREVFKPAIAIDMGGYDASGAFRPLPLCLMRLCLLNNTGLRVMSVVLCRLSLSAICFGALLSQHGARRLLSAARPREVNYTFKELGRQQVLLSQIVVSTGVVHRAEDSVVVKVNNVDISTRVAVPHMLSHYCAMRGALCFDNRRMRPSTIASCSPGSCLDGARQAAQQQQ